MYLAGAQRPLPKTTPPVVLNLGNGEKFYLRRHPVNFGRLTLGPESIADIGAGAVGLRVYRREFCGRTETLQTAESRVKAAGSISDCGDRQHLPASEALFRAGPLA